MLFPLYYNQGTTNKKEWDAFVRSAQSKSFPLQLSGVYRKAKVSLFGMWLDSGRDWDATVLKVEQVQEQETLARRQMQAVKAKTLKQEMGDQKFAQLKQLRESQGLFYKDDDFPDDPEDWFDVWFEILFFIGCL